MKELLSVYTRLLDFQGRSSVREFIIYMLFAIGVSMPLAYLDMSNSGFDQPLSIGSFLGVFMVLNFLPNLALSVRRLHDLNLSGLWVLINFVPLVGPFILLFMLLQPATKEDNRFGPVSKRS